MPRRSSVWSPLSRSTFFFDPARWRWLCSIRTSIWRIAFRTIRNTGPHSKGEQNRTVSQYLFKKSCWCQEGRQFEALCHVPRFSLTLPAGDNYVVSGRVYGRGRIAFRTIRNTGPLFQGEQNRTISQHPYIKSTSKSHETVAGLNPADPDVSIL